MQKFIFFTNIVHNLKIAPYDDRSVNTKFIEDPILKIDEQYKTILVLLPLKPLDRIDYKGNLPA